MRKKDIFRLSIQDNSRHEESMHTEIELLFVLEGSLNVKVEQREFRLQEEDIIVINPNKRYALNNSENYLLMQLSINYQEAYELMDNTGIIFLCDSSKSQNESYDKLRMLLKRLLKHYIEKKDYEQTFGYMADCYAILHQLAANFMVKPAEIQAGDEDDRYEERIGQINQYIHSNYAQPINMKELSDKLYLSNGYLSRFFKKNYGMTFGNYLTNVRVFHAADELLHTDVPITAVAYNVGFTSVAFFNKVFKKSYGITPTEFRRQTLEAKTAEHDAEKLDALKKRVEEMIVKEEFGIADDQEAKTVKKCAVECSVKKTESYQKYWGDTINFGEADNLLHSNIQEHLLLLQRALEFKYVRFWNLLTEEFHIKPDQEYYDFSKIDAVLDFVLEQNMIPYIDLGIRPVSICYTLGQAVVRKEHFSDYTCEQWEQLMRIFVRHLSIRYGQSALSNWRFELWFDESRRTEKIEQKRYLDRFEVTYRVFKEINKNIEIGGYGVRMDFGWDDRRTFLSEWKKRQCGPDFISYYYNAYERGSDGLDIYAKRSTDDDRFIHLIEKEIKIMEESGIGEIPMYVSLWNLTPSVRNFIHDSTFKGAYIIKNNIDLWGKVKSMAYSTGSDMQCVSFDTMQPLFGGDGLITKNGFLKPAGFAFYFMNRLFQNLVEKDRNYVITTDGHDNYAIVCHNQQKLNYNYYLTSETELEKESLWKYQEGRQKLKLQFRLNDIREGRYQIKVNRINDFNGSVLGIWAELGYENELSKSDIQHFRRVCEPKLNIKYAETEKNVLEINEEMLMNEIAFISIRYVMS